MTTEAVAKYEAQLPKFEKYSFERIFGYVSGLASITGLIAIPVFIKDQSILAYAVIALLATLVLLLFLHAIFIANRKLHRYAQTVFFIHFAQHLVRDSLSELQINGKDEIKKTTEKILDAIANCFSIVSGKRCRAILIEMDSGFELRNACRDSMSQIRSKPRSKKNQLSENTDFENLWYSINGCSRYYLNNNIKKTWLQHKYKNSSFEENGQPEFGSILWFNFFKKWPLAYSSALVLPLRYVSEFSPPKNADVPVPHWNYWGFLCIDSISKNSFDERYSTELGAIFADMLYTYLNQANYILDNLTQPIKIGK